MSASQFLHNFDSFQRLDSPYENRFGNPFFSCDDVCAEVHAIGEVHVQVPSFPKHYFISLRLSAISMTCRVNGSPICLDLDNLADEFLTSMSANDEFAEKFFRYLDGGLKIEVAGKLFQCRMQIVKREDWSFLMSQVMK